MPMPKPEMKWVRLRAVEYIRQRKSTREAVEAAVNDWRRAYAGTFILEEYDIGVRPGTTTMTTIQPRI